jgi:phage terminase large subunit GpA-like protein
MSTKSERAEAIERLRDWLKPGDTIHCVLRHVSRSGMSRVIDFKKIEANGEVSTLGWNIAKALEMPFDRNREGVKVGGCGMDMGFHIVYNLARTLWPESFDCTGERCPSNDHSNGDRDRTPHRHSDGGYALLHRWL